MLKSFINAYTTGSLLLESKKNIPVYTTNLHNRIQTIWLSFSSHLQPEMSWRETVTASLTIEDGTQRQLFDAVRKLPITVIGK